MYLQHFGLAHQPFTATADTPSYYPATGHELALGRLRTALALEDGFVVLTAEPGLGKSLLAHRLLGAMDGNTLPLLITNTSLNGSAALFQTLLFDLGQPYEGRSEQELRLLVINQLLHGYDEEKRTVLLIDEAHHLPPYLLEELRLLGNLESRQGKVLQVVLIGLPGLLTTLARPELAALQQRIRVRPTLGPLDAHEAADYVAHRVRAVGGRPDRLFTEEALDLLARGTRGIPRLLNQAAEQALQLAATVEQRTVDAEAVLEALAELGLATEEEARAGAEPAAESPPAREEVISLRPVEDQTSMSSASARPRRLFMSGRRPA